jgi:predicted transglutaminase-like cysteine proteinase
MVRRNITILLMGLASAGLGACTNGPITGSTNPDPFQKMAAGGTSAIVRAMPATIAVAPPPGYIGFCIRQPDQCKTPDGAASQMILTPANWKTLDQVNRTTNDEIWQEDDQKHYGRAEYWTIPTDGYGDCEDIVLAKRKKLMDMGMPVPSLRIAVVITPKHESHAVLTVTTDHGDYVLDSLHDEILPWDQTGYIWIERQDSSRSSGWVSLTSPQMLASLGLTMTSQVN